MDFVQSIAGHNEVQRRPRRQDASDCGGPEPERLVMSPFRR